MLNYGYAMLISQVRTAVVAACFDLSIGFTHRRSWKPIPLVYDSVESLRPMIDHKILELALEHSFMPVDFKNNSESGCSTAENVVKEIREESGL
jgi:CRISPR/Cas system-associated endonuclease Cas1